MFLKIAIELVIFLANFWVNFVNVAVVDFSGETKSDVEAKSRRSKTLYSLARSSRNLNPYRRPYRRKTCKTDTQTAAEFSAEL